MKEVKDYKWEQKQKLERMEVLVPFIIAIAAIIIIALYNIFIYNRMAFYAIIWNIAVIGIYKIVKFFIEIW